MCQRPLTSHVLSICNGLRSNLLMRQPASERPPSWTGPGTRPKASASLPYYSRAPSLRAASVRKRAPSFLCAQFLHASESKRLASSPNSALPARTRPEDSTFLQFLHVSESKRSALASPVLPHQPESIRKRAPTVPFLACPRQNASASVPCPFQPMSDSLSAHSLPASESKRLRSVFVPGHHV